MSNKRLKNPPWKSGCEARAEAPPPPPPPPPPRSSTGKNTVGNTGRAMMINTIAFLGAMVALVVVAVGMAKTSRENLSEFVERRVEAGTTPARVEMLADWCKANGFKVTYLNTEKTGPFGAQCEAFVALPNPDYVMRR